MYAIFAIDIRIETTSGGSLLDTDRSTAFGWCGSCGVQFEGSKQSHGHTRQHGLSRSQNVLSTRCAGRSSSVKMVVQGFQEKVGTR